MPGRFAGLLFLLFLKIRFAHDRRPATRRRYGKRVQIPRCRATVSEDNGGRPLGAIFGKKIPKILKFPGRTPQQAGLDQSPYSQARRPA